MNAIDNEASCIFIADGIDLFGISNLHLKQMSFSVLNFCFILNIKNSIILSYGKRIICLLYLFTKIYVT